MSNIRIAFITCCLLLPGRAMGACLELSGEPRQGALLWGRVSPGSEVRLGDEALRVSSDGVVVFGFGRDESGQRRLTVRGEAECSQTLDIAARDYRIQRIEGVPQRTVTPDPADLERIRREAARVRAARANTRSATDFAAGFQWPVTGPISGVYGSQRVYNGTPGRPHYGVDIAVPTGTPVTTPAPGRVTLAEPDLFYSGGTVIIDHGNEVSSTFLHLDAVLVEVGQQVAPGDTVGRVGATGRATGPHLDWRMNWRDRRVDPALLVPTMPD
ncbi:MAG: M23 family metallopeptidase [Halieaceae bacterium]|nr:M23 family metallopeptidase [Halieaceae bacterium]